MRWPVSCHCTHGSRICFYLKIQSEQQVLLKAAELGARESTERRGSQGDAELSYALFPGSKVIYSIFKAWIPLTLNIQFSFPSLKPAEIGKL